MMTRVQINHHALSGPECWKRLPWTSERQMKCVSRGDGEADGRGGSSLNDLACGSSKRALRSRDARGILILHAVAKIRLNAKEFTLHGF
jgi:hypothetical protein